MRFTRDALRDRGGCGNLSYLDDSYVRTDAALVTLLRVTRPSRMLPYGMLRYAITALFHFEGFFRASVNLSQLWLFDLARRITGHFAKDDLPRPLVFWQRF